MAEIEQKGQSFLNLEAIDAFGAEMSVLAESRWRKFTKEKRAISVQNLVRLRCLSTRPSPLDISNLFAKLPQERGGRGVVSFGSSWAAIDPQKFQKLLQDLMERQMISSGMLDFKSHSSFTLPVNVGSFFSSGGREIDLPEASFMLTPLGRGLTNACRKDLTGKVDSGPG